LTSVNNPNPIINFDIELSLSKLNIDTNSKVAKKAFVFCFLTSKDLTALRMHQDVLNSQRASLTHCWLKLPEFFLIHAEAALLFPIIALLEAKFQ